MTHRLVARYPVHVHSAMMSLTKLLHPEVASYILCHHLHNQFLRMKRRKNLVLDKINSRPFTAWQSVCFFISTHSIIFMQFYYITVKGEEEKKKGWIHCHMLGLKWKTRQELQQLWNYQNVKPFFPFNPSTGRSCQRRQKKEARNEWKFRMVR